MNLFNPFIIIGVYMFGFGIAKSVFNFFVPKDVNVTLEDKFNIFASFDGNDTITGGSKVDIINSGAGNDVIFGGAGDDIIDGGSGNDMINGGSGKNTLKGDAGDDRIIGGDDKDIIFGGSGNDNIRSLNGNDIIHTGSGNNVVDAGSGDDTVFGGHGNDTIAGGAGNDNLFGGAGNDRIAGSSGSETLFGGSGRDIFFYNNLNNSFEGEVDLIGDFEVGNDRLFFGGFSQTLNSVDDFVITNLKADGSKINLSDTSTNFSLDIAFSGNDFELTAANFIFAGTSGSSSMDVMQSQAVDNMMDAPDVA